MRKRRPRHTDPMREVDLLLLEDALMHRNVDTNGTAVAARTACMTIVGLLFFAAFLYSLTHRETVVAATSRLQQSPAAVDSALGQAGLPQP